jgi:hypothetical protein
LIASLNDTLWKKKTSYFLESLAFSEIFFVLNKFTVIYKIWLRIYMLTFRTCNQQKEKNTHIFKAHTWICRMINGMLKNIWKPWQKARYFEISLAEKGKRWNSSTQYKTLCKYSYTAWLRKRFVRNSEQNGCNGVEKKLH